MNRNRRAAFTLLEVILALALTVIVMAAIGTAIFLHLRVVDRTRIATERDQLARTLLRRIGDDLRSAVRREPFDDSALKSMMQAASKSGKSGGKGSSGKGGSGADSPSSSASGGASKSGVGRGGTTKSAGTAGSAGAAKAAGTAKSLSGESIASSGSDETTATTATAAVAGVYGTAYDLQIDIARVPRPDEFNTAMLAGVPVPSDVKTVYYFLANAAAGLSPNGESGLMRAEMNRATALYANENGDTDIYLRNGELLAVEVAGLEFRYFDGTEWLTEWSSQEKNGLPLAIEVALVIVDPVTPIEGVMSGSLFDPVSTIDPELVYRTLVQLPNAQAPSSGSSTGSGSSSDSSNSSSSQNGSGTGTGSSGTGSSGSSSTGGSQ